MKNIRHNLYGLAAILAIAPVTLVQADGHKKEITELKERIEQLEKSAVTKGKKGGIKIGDTTLKIGGYVKLDVLHTNNGVNGAAQAFIAAPQIASATNGGRKHLDLTARESRFNIISSTPFGGKPLTTRLEFDLYGSNGTETSSNSHNLRMRHAVGSWGNWTMGQTWTTFMDLAAIPELNAFGLYSGALFARQAQIRYTHKFDGGSVMAAMENPQNTGGDNQNRPDLVGRVNINGDWGHASAAVLQRVLVDPTKGKANGTAVSFTAKIPTIGKDNFIFQHSSGVLGRYMSLGAFDGIDTTGATTKTFESKGTTAGYTHWWNGSLRSTVLYSVAEASDDRVVGSSSVEEITSTHVNLFWQANPKLRYGLEYAKWEGELEGGTEKDFDAIQFSARYAF